LNRKILLTGVSGQVGHALYKVFSNSSHDYDLVPLDRNQLDLTNADHIRYVVQSIKPEIIINPAAYTAVDKAESEADLAFAVNAIAPKIMAEEAAKLNASLIHFSTDYVYKGNKSDAYQETDPTEPLSVYGQSKLAGEDAIRAVGLPHLIFRTSWVYGSYGKNFMKTILRLANERETLNVVADQMGAPTSSQVIADAVTQVLNKFLLNPGYQKGLYHLVNTGRASWHEFATAIVDDANVLRREAGRAPLLVKSIHPISTEQYPTPAKRPANSLLDTSKLTKDFGILTPHWRKSLQQELAILQTLEN
jgi:dTDP-4-dehydrorhamnose reductase